MARHKLGPLGYLSAGISAKQPSSYWLNRFGRMLVAPSAEDYLAELISAYAKANPKRGLIGKPLVVLRTHRV